MRLTTRLLGGAIVATLLAAPALAGGTLERIRQSGTIVLGYRDASIPFSYLAGEQTPVGYSHDLQLKVVEAVKTQLKLPQLQVNYRLVTPQTRIPLVQNGLVDLECGSTTNNLERQKQVAFSTGIFAIGTRLLTAKTSGVRDFPDLKGKNVVTTSGTTSERLLKAMNAEKQMGMHVVSAKDHGEAFQLLESGHAVAFMMDDVLLYGELVKARNPANWVVTGKPQSYEIYGCTLHKDDPAFKKLVDDALKAVFRSGEIGAIYRKWFSSPVPPRGLNLNFPMSDEVKQLIAKPTDKSAEQM